MKKNRIKTPAANTLTRADVIEEVSLIRTLKIAERKIKADRDAAVKEIDERCAPELEAIAADIENAVERCRAWAEVNPQEFEKRKSIECAHGIFGFRTGTPKLALLSRAWNWDKCLEKVRELLPAFIRDTPTIDKEALLAQRDEEIVQFAIKGCGMKVVQDESFYVEPIITEVETRETSEVAK